MRTGEGEQRDNSYSVEICRKAWDNPKFIFLKIVPGNVIESGEFKNRG